MTEAPSSGYMVSDALERMPEEQQAEYEAIVAILDRLDVER